MSGIWRAQDAVKCEHEGANRGDDIFLTVESTVFEVEVKDDNGFIFLKYNYNTNTHVFKSL
jgi:hypothetical protein